jgi:hypothetical protein
LSSQPLRLQPRPVSSLPRLTQSPPDFAWRNQRKLDYNPRCPPLNSPHTPLVRIAHVTSQLAAAQANVAGIRPMHSVACRSAATLPAPAPVQLLVALMSLPSATAVKQAQAFLASASSHRSCAHFNPAVASTTSPKRALTPWLDPLVRNFPPCPVPVLRRGAATMQQLGFALGARPTPLVAVIAKVSCSLQSLSLRA